MKHKIGSEVNTLRRIISGFILGTAMFSSNANAATHTLHEQQLIRELTGVTKNSSHIASSDVDLYADLIAADQDDKEVLFQQRLAKILQERANSPFADNALFIAAQRAWTKKDYSSALKYLKKIESDYATSNKYVSALLLKAQCYRFLELPDLAKQVLIDVKAKFPGSPESFRASLELKLLK